MLLPNDPMDPIADGSGALTGPLAGAIVVTRDLATLQRAYADGLGLTVRGPFVSDARAVEMQRALWGLPTDLGYQLCVMERVRVPDAIKVLVIIPDRDTPRIRNTYAREETGPYALGFPMKAIEQVDERMIELGFRRTLPAINRYELQLRDGRPYPINEASYEVVDNTRLVALSRGGGLHTYLAPSMPGRSMSFSVSTRYCGQVSPWIFSPRCCARRISSIAARLLTWTIIASVSTISAKLIARCVASRSTGIGRDGP